MADIEKIKMLRRISKQLKSEVGKFEPLTEKYLYGIINGIDLAISLINEELYELEKEYKLTEKGRKKVEQYIKELNAKRKEILDAKLDTADSTDIPDVETIESDIAAIGLDDDDEYYNNWAVTDNYDGDYAIVLKLGEDFE